jgi:hypothetical protein
MTTAAASSLALHPRRRLHARLHIAARPDVVWDLLVPYLGVCAVALRRLEHLALEEVPS